MDGWGRRVGAVALSVGVACGSAACDSGERAASTNAPDATDPATTPTTATTLGPTTSTTATTTTTTTVPGPPVAADSPAGLAAQILEAERTVRNPSTEGPALARAGHTQQVAYGRLAVRQEWQAEVVSLVPAEYQPVVEANISAVTDLARQAAADRAGSGGGTSTLPDWRIVTPPPPAELLAEYRSAEAASGVPWPYLAAIHFVETRMGRIRGNSVAGAQGPMQFIPSTWDIYGDGGDINSNHDAIHAAARMLRANGAPSDMASALYAYNHSDRYVRAITLYAELIRANERAYHGYYHWQVYFGSRLLPEGYGS